MGRISTYDYDTGRVLFVTTVGAKAMTTRMISGKYSLSQNCALLIPKSDSIDVRFYRYFIDRLFDYEKGMISLIMQPSLRFEDLLRYQIVVPLKEEQNEVAEYLDRKTAQIDDLIAKKERMIELLKEERSAVINQAVTRGLDPNVELKDSGNGWLGKVPKHWKIKKLKYLCRKIGSGITPKGGASVYLTEGIPILRSQNIHFDEFKLDDVAYISEEMHKGLSATRVLVGDVLLNITGASIGRCNYWRDNGEANVNQHVCILRPNSKIGTKYLHFYLSSEIGQHQIDRSQNGVSREGLNYEDLGDFIIPLPHEKEQKYIVDFLDRKTAQIDTQIEREKKSIELLKEFRTALISEVVTGKIDVRDEN